MAVTTSALKVEVKKYTFDYTDLSSVTPVGISNKVFLHNANGTPFQTFVPDDWGILNLDSLPTGSVLEMLWIKKIVDDDAPDGIVLLVKGADWDNVVGSADKAFAHEYELGWKGFASVKADHRQSQQTDGDLRQLDVASQPDAIGDGNLVVSTKDELKIFAMVQDPYMNNLTQGQWEVRARVRVPTV